MADDPTIQVVSTERRVFPPPAEFAQRAAIGSREAYAALYKRSIDDPEGFFSEQARELRWQKAPTRTLDWQPPFAKWFADGKLNLSDNCLDRHVEGARADKPAIIWEGEPGETRVLSYRELLQEVSRFANALEGLGIRAGDRVGIYMGMVPEAAIAMLACARIGAIHSVIFGGFAAEAVRDRMNDAQAKCIITQDGAYRRGSVVPLKPHVDKAIEACPSVEHVIVLDRCHNAIDMQPGRDLRWSELVANASPTHVAPA